MVAATKKEMSAYALLVALLGGGGGFAGFNAAVDVADARWMTHEQHAASDIKIYLKTLKRELRRLEHKEHQGTLTNDEAWELKDLKALIKELEEELT